MTYTNERLELAAIAAETWKEHGDLECVNYWHNADGFG